ncbi:MAG: YcxB family protein [Roseburia sp.]
MTILYEVKTGHTKKVVKAFVKFYDGIRKDKTKIMLRYGVLAGLFFLIPRALEMPVAGYVICWFIGILVVILAFSKNWLNYMNMLHQDKYYQKGIEIVISFGLSAFEVKDEEKNVYKYHLIKNMYDDKEMFYLHMEDGDLFIIPKEDFTVGSPEDFRDFLQKATDKQFESIS